MREDIAWLLGEEWYTAHRIRLWDAQKSYHKGIFGDSKVILNLNEYKSFIFVTRVTQLIHDAGKYLLISVYPLPTHPTHNFTHKNGGNLETLPGWPKNLQHNRPVRSAGQWNVDIALETSWCPFRYWKLEHYERAGSITCYWHSCFLRGQAIGCIAIEYAGWIVLIHLTRNDINNLCYLIVEIW